MASESYKPIVLYAAAAATAASSAENRLPIFGHSERISGHVLLTKVGRTEKEVPNLQKDVIFPLIK